MNRWGIPDWLEVEVKKRDRNCVYCRVDFEAANHSKKSTATWEHIINDARIITPENIARCCASCNASKGAKHLSAWLKSDYCQRRGISEDTIAEVAKRALHAQLGVSKLPIS